MDCRGWKQESQNGIGKVTTVDRIEVVDSTFVQVRTKTAILENGTQLSATYHRRAIAPGEDYSGENDQVQKVCKVAHTPDVISAYKAALVSQK